VSRLIDGREMEPPEPFEATLAALDALGLGEELTLLVYCSPHPLFNVLRRNRFKWREAIQADGTHEIRISHAA
jgi:uncharacterized protein (DUF2249 family)